LGAYFDLDLGILIWSRRVRTRSCARVSGSRAGEVGAVRGRGRKIWREEDGRGRVRVRKKRAQLEKFGGGISPSVRQRAGEAAKARERAGDRWRARASARAQKEERGRGRSCGGGAWMADGIHRLYAAVHNASHGGFLRPREYRRPSVQIRLGFLLFLH